MYQNDIFYNEEWKHLQLSIPVIFYAIAGVDHKIDKKEIAAMNIILENASAFKSELMQEVLASIDDDAQTLIDILIQKDINIYKALDEIKLILSNKLERKEAMDFKKTLIAIGAYIGDSSGKFLHRKLSYEEEDELLRIGYHLDVPVKELMMTSILERLLERLKEN